VPEEMFHDLRDVLRRSMLSFDVCFHLRG
jgi:hypothetical protein